MVDTRQLIDGLIKIIKLLKPEFYNKLTWAVVGAGIALITSPVWWTLFLSEILNYFGVQAPQTDKNEPWLGIPLITLGLTYHLIITKNLLHSNEKADSAKLNHDIEIFNQSKNIVSEDAFSNFLDTLYGDHSYRDKLFSQICDYGDFFKKPENKFITKELKDSAQRMSDAISILTDWCATHFFVFPEYQKGENLKFCMQPELNIDRGSRNEGSFKLYDKLTKELNEMITSTDTSYKEYRQSIKEKCFL